MLTPIWLNLELLRCGKKKNETMPKVLTKCLALRYYYHIDCHILTTLIAYITMRSVKLRRAQVERRTDNGFGNAGSRKNHY